MVILENIVVRGLQYFLYYYLLASGLCEIFRTSNKKYFSILSEMAVYIYFIFFLRTLKTINSPNCLTIFNLVRNFVVVIDRYLVNNVFKDWHVTLRTNYKRN